MCRSKHCADQDPEIIAQAKPRKHACVGLRKFDGSGHVYPHNLRQARDSWPGPKYPPEPSFQDHDFLVGQAGPGPHQTHFPDEHIPELRNFIQFETPKNFPPRCDRSRFYQMGALWIRAWFHRAEFDYSEHFFFSPHPRLQIKRIARLENQGA